MKAPLLTLVASLLALGTQAELRAQKSDFKPQLWLGGQAGVHASRYQFVPSVPQGMAIGMGAGLRARVDLERGASAQLELNYVQTGWSERYDDGRSSERRLSYVELPVMTHLYLNTKAVRIFVNLGPFVGYALSDEHRASGTSFTEAQTLRQTMPIKNKFAWGLAGGPGISLALGQKHRIELEGRASYNFQDIWGNKRTDAYGQSTELRMGISLGYLYRF